MSLGLKLRLVRNAASPMPCGRYSLTPLLRGQARVPSGLQHSHDRSQRMQVLCMAHPRRVARVASQVQREIGDMLVTDNVMQTAICPDRRLGNDQLSAVASITNVYVSNDLQFVRIYISIYSDEKGKQKALENLRRLEPYVRKALGSRMRLRLTPEVVFEYDDSLEELELVEKVLGQDEINRFKRELDEEAAAASGRTAVEAQEQAEDDEEDDEEEEEEEEEEFDEEEEEDEEDTAAQQGYTYRGPFDDLFVGEEGGGMIQDRDKAAALTAARKQNFLAQQEQAQRAAANKQRREQRQKGEQLAQERQAQRQQRQKQAPGAGVGR